MHRCAHCDVSELGVPGAPPFACGTGTLGPSVSLGSSHDRSVTERLFWCSAGGPPAVSRAVGSWMQSRVRHRRELPCSCSVCQREGFMGRTELYSGTFIFPLHACATPPSHHPSASLRKYIFPPTPRPRYRCFFLASFESNTGRGWQRRHTA